MTDMESLEDMLAALEGPSSGELGNDLEGISNIDEFLDQIEEEARMSSKGRLNTNFELEYYDTPATAPAKRAASPSNAQPMRSAAPSNAQPMRSAAPSNVQPMRTASPSNVQPMRAASPSNAQPARTAAPSNVQPMRAASPSVAHGQSEAELQSQGYQKHNNKGKWINYAGGKATDFRIRGTTSTRVGLAHVITLRALDDFGNPARVDNPREFIGVTLTHVQSGGEIQCWLRDNGNGEYDIAFCSERPGSIRMEIKLAGNPMFDLEIQVEDLGTSLWVAKPRLPVKPRDLFVIDIETVDGSRPEGVAPFEVQTIGSVDNLRLINNGDGTYRFQCTPQVEGHITVQLTLHGQPIKNSPVTVQVGERKPIKIRQESQHEETISDTRTGYGTQPQPQRHNQSHQHHQPHQPVVVEEDYLPDDGGDYDQFNDGFGTDTFGAGSYRPRESTADVSNEDLNRLLDELGG